MPSERVFSKMLGYYFVQNWRRIVYPNPPPAEIVVKIGKSHITAKLILFLIQFLCYCRNTFRITTAALRRDFTFCLNAAKRLRNKGMGKTKVVAKFMA